MTLVSGSTSLARADGIALIGEMRGSGYRNPPALVRRGDGQTLQLTRLLYLVLEAVDGARSDEEIAARVSTAYGRRVSVDNVRTLVDNQLRPLGLLARADGSQPQVQKADPLLALRFRYAVTDPHRTRRITAPFARLFHPLLVLPLVVAFGVTCWWLLWEKGLASATYEAFDKPALLLLIFVVSVLSAGFHEFGHAAAARYGGATPGVMGLGLYLVWPAFYTDVTDSYRLGRRGRVRTDLGGLYFNAIVAVGIVAVWWASGYDGLLLVIVTQILQMVRQLAPLVRFDGYHVLADVTGVPDLFQHIKPTLLGLLPWRWRSPQSRVLKPWARAVVTTWVLLVVPLLLACLTLLVVALPRVLATAWASLQEQWAMLGSSWVQGDLFDAGARILSLVAVAFPVLAIGYILVRLVRRVVASVWRRTSGHPVQRSLAALTAGALVAGLAWAWWPDDDKYRPIMPYERGTVADAVPASLTGSSGMPDGQAGRAQVLWPAGVRMPAADSPLLALVLVPREAQDTNVASPSSVDVAGDPVTTGGEAPAGKSATVESPTTTGEPEAEAPTWVFPFDRPLPPDAGDNQALAVNTQDGSVVYDVAFALVWVEEETVVNTNEAYAFASCRGCASVAVGFQVLLVAGQADVVVPQNIAAAVNYNCVDCLTYALATQLVVTLDGPLSAAGTAEMQRLWAEIAAYGERIEEVPLADIRAELTAYEQRILEIIRTDPGTGAPSDDSSAGGDMPTSTRTAPVDTSDGETRTGDEGSDGTSDADTEDSGGGESAGGPSTSTPSDPGAGPSPTTESSTPHTSEGRPSPGSTRPSPTTAASPTAGSPTASSPEPTPSPTADSPEGTPSG
ncbi:MAG TPA: hypothetical protein VHG70_15600 [Nocardioidaceae bacterium]|nr:hypothetical protein [Nocardioidaceae bacterium]